MIKKQNKRRKKFLSVLVTCTGNDTNFSYKEDNNNGTEMRVLVYYYECCKHCYPHQYNIAYEISHRGILKACSL